MAYTLIHHTLMDSPADDDDDLSTITAALESELLSEDELRDIARKMGKVSPRTFLREKDAAKFGLAEDASDDEVFAAMAAEPRLIQRPIGINGRKAVLGRPNERLLDIA